MRSLILVHRWLGILLCLLVAMWFASGIVMHFVPFPTLTETERLDGLPLIDQSQVALGPGESVHTSGIKGIEHVRLLQRPDGPIYLLSGAQRVTVRRAHDIAATSLTSAELALTTARDHAQRRGLDASHAAVAMQAPVDQWTVSSSFDPDRPLFRITLNDASGTEIYVSSTTGLVNRDTTRWERRWNYLGSVAHWIYPTVLRTRPSLWAATVWALSFLALIASFAGALLGLLRTRTLRGKYGSPYRGWQKWHHLLGLTCMVFVLTWTFSGWLSMDGGRLFSAGSLTQEEARKVAETPAWNALQDDRQTWGSAAKEIEWFFLDGRFYRRERTGPAAQRLFLVGESPAVQAEFLVKSVAGALIARIREDCKPPFVVLASDNYPILSQTPNAPVYRVVCGDTWYHVDGASGAILERLDPSRRTYRWLFGALHTMDFPGLVEHPLIRSALIVGLCTLGFLFSVTAIVIGWLRLFVAVIGEMSRALCARRSAFPRNSLTRKGS